MNSLDMLIFAELSYCPFEDLAEEDYRGRSLLSLERKVYPGRGPENNWKWQQQLFRLWRELPKYPRFHEVRLLDFVSASAEIEAKQFAAALFGIKEAEEDSVAVAFRGTDLTVNGWREDFNLAYESPVPAQTDAGAYLNAIAEEYGRIYVCGHSKGGNLAMYGAAVCGIPEHIISVYNFDGPGLDKEVLSSPGWQAVSGKINYFVPESSVIGILFSFDNAYTVVRSGNPALLQHDGFTWLTEGTDFVIAEDLSPVARGTGIAVRDFLDETTGEQRAFLVGKLFRVIEKGGAKRVDELGRGLLLHLPSILNELDDNFSPGEKERLRNLGGELLEKYRDALIEEELFPKRSLKRIRKKDSRKRDRLISSVSHVKTMLKKKKEE